MKHQHHFGRANVIALREVVRIGTLIGDLDRRAQLLDGDIAAEEECARVFNPLDAAYPVRARTWAAHRDNLKATIATLEKRCASLQERADKVPAKCSPAPLAQDGVSRVPNETLLQQFSLDREVGLKRKSASMAVIKQRGAVMLALILGFIYQHSCRKYLAAVRTYQRRWT